MLWQKAVLPALWLWLIKGTWRLLEVAASCWMLHWVFLVVAGDCWAGSRPIQEWCFTTALSSLHNDSANGLIANGWPIHHLKHVLEAELPCK